MATKQHVLRTLATALCIALLLPGPAAARKRPNILFIIMDDVGIDQMRTFGYQLDNQPELPNIDTIAQAGIRFRNVWSLPECSPSRVGFFTGRFPLRTGVMTAFINTDLANSQMSPYETTAPRVLHSAAYKSALFGKYHLAGPYNYPTKDLAPHDAGFDYFYGDLEGSPRPLDTTVGGLYSTGTYTCGFVSDARFGACRFADGRCQDLGNPADTPGPGPGRSCLELGGILVKHQTCADMPAVIPDFSLYNGYYVAPLVIIDEAGNLMSVDPTDARARRYLTIQQTDAAIDWITQQQAAGTAWMATVSYSAAHVPTQQVPTSIVPDQPAGTGSFHCDEVPAQRILQNHMTEAIDVEVGRLLTSVGLTTRDAGGNLVYDPAKTDTMIIIVGDNGTYGPSVKAPFDPSRAKGFTYQTGVWVPLITAGPVVNPANIGKQIDSMVNVVDLYRLFGELAGVDVRKQVPKTHTLDAQSMLPYLKKASQREIRRSNFTQTGANLHAASTTLWPCVIKSFGECVQLFTFEGLCNAEGGVWYGPGNPDYPEGLPDCCAVNAATQKNYSIYPKAQWAMRDDQYKLVKTQIENCTTSQFEEQYEFFTIDDAAPLPQLDRADANLLTSPYLPAQGLDKKQLAAFKTLNSKLEKMLASEPECTGDGNMDKRVNQLDLQDWASFQGVGSSRYDLNLDAQTNNLDQSIIQDNLGLRCPLKKTVR